MNMKPLAGLVEQNRLARLTRDLYIQTIPLDIDEGVLLRPPISGTPINHELPGFFRSGFQVIVRSRTYEAGLERLNRIVDVLTLVATDVGPQHFLFCRPTTQPVSFPLSRGNLVEWNVQFECAFTE